MERTRKHLLAAVLALAAALILAVPALAADEYTLVGTADELMTALNSGAEKIRFTKDIDMAALSQTPTSNLVITSSLELDLNGCTWTIPVFNGNTGRPGDETVAPLYFGSGDNLDRNFVIQNGTISVKDADNRYALWQYSGTLTLSGVTMNGGVAVGGTCEIINCQISRNSSTGAAALWVSDGGRVEKIQNSTLTGKGSSACGIFLQSNASIGEILACTVTGDENSGDNGGITGSGAIGRIVMEDGFSIDEIRGVSITEGIELVTGGEIGTITGCEISAGAAPGSDDELDAAIWVTNGTIGRIEGNTITAQEAFGIVNTGTISDLGENAITSGATRGGQPAHVVNDGGTLCVTAEGTVKQVSFDFGSGAFMKDVFIADEGGWYVQNTGAGGTVTTPNATEEDVALRFTGQIRLIEPWGLRVNVGIPGVETSKISSVVVTFIQGGTTKEVTAEYNAAYSQAKGCADYSADLTGIQTQYLNESISFTAEVSLADGTTLSSEEEKTVNMVSILTSCAASSDYTREERNVYTAILNWFNAYQAYLEK